MKRILAALLTLLCGTVQAAPSNSVVLSQIGAVYNRTAAEILASVTPTNYGYPPMDALRYGADCTGVANSAAAIQSAISVAAVNGGVALLEPNCTFNLGTTGITLASNVTVRAYGATVNYSGSGVMVTSATTGTLQYPGMEGGAWNAGSASTKIVELYSPYKGTFRDLTLNSTSTTNTGIDILVNTTGSTNPDGNYNAAFCLFSNILEIGTNGRGLRLIGNSTGPKVVTLNRFVNFTIGGGGASAIAGIDINSWSDNNTWIGTRISLQAPTNASGIGVIWNSGSPSSNVGVYANNFYDLSVDCFSNPAGDARVGAQLNWTKQNEVQYFYQSPVCAGGSYTTTANTQSTSIYLVNDTIGAVYTVGGQAIFNGTSTNDNASAGQVGQIIQSVVGSGSAVSLSTSVAANVTSITLTPGDWDVWGQVAYLFGATTTVTFLGGATSTTSATLGSLAIQASQLVFASFSTGGTGMTITPPAQRISVNTNTTVYLVAQAAFGTSTLSAYGSITARRRR